MESDACGRVLISCTLVHIATLCLTKRGICHAPAVALVPPITVVITIAVVRVHECGSLRSRLKRRPSLLKELRLLDGITCARAAAASPALPPYGRRAVVVGSLRDVIRAVARAHAKSAPSPVPTIRRLRRVSYNNRRCARVARRGSDAVLCSVSLSRGVLQQQKLRHDRAARSKGMLTGAWTAAGAAGSLQGRANGRCHTHPLRAEAGPTASRRVGQATSPWGDPEAACPVVVCP